MKTIIIPDLHHNTRWVQTFLNRCAPYDEVVFLGDYFDDFNDNIRMAENTANWLKWSLQDPKHKHCIGNHDVPYMTLQWNSLYDCPGFSMDKDDVINNVLTRADWDQLVPAVFTQGWLISHAGFDIRLAQGQPFTDDPLSTPAQLIKSAARGWQDALRGKHNAFFVPGVRMGQPYVGGITWADWNELVPIVGIQQIVGHTPSDHVRMRRVSKTQTDYCIDTNCKDAAIITDGKIEIVKI